MLLRDGLDQQLGKPRIAAREGLLSLCGQHEEILRATAARAGAAGVDQTVPNEEREMLAHGRACDGRRARELVDARARLVAQQVAQQALARLAERLGHGIEDAGIGGLRLLLAY